MIDGPFSAGLDHDQHPSRFLKGGKEFRDGFAADELAFGSVFFEQRVRLGDRPVVQRHGIAVVGEVAGDVGAHHGETGDPDLSGAGGVRGFRVAHSGGLSSCSVVVERRGF